MNERENYIPSFPEEDILNRMYDITDRFLDMYGYFPNHISMPSKIYKKLLKSKELQDAIDKVKNHNYQSMMNSIYPRMIKYAEQSVQLLEKLKDNKQEWLIHICHMRNLPQIKVIDGYPETELVLPLF